MKISASIAEKDYGITCLHEKMNNNELRFRLRCKDGSGYIRTVAGYEGAWQNSHFHKSIKETYIVQSGWIAFCCLVDGELEISIYHPGELVTTESFVAHNLYLSAGSIIHTVKHGVAKENDWLADEKLNEMTKILTESDIAILVLDT